jgi:ATP-dependent helicase HrpA
VSIRVPIGLLEAVDETALEWSVPGFLPLVCEQWLRALPKARRRPLAPLPEKVEAIMALLARPDRYRQGRLTTALGQAIRELYGVVATAEDWDRSRVDPHLLINVQVLDEAGAVVAQGRDAAELKRRFAERLQRRMGAGLRERAELHGLDAFPDGVDPTASLLVDDDAGPVAAYPALVDGGDHVDLRLFPSVQAQAEANRRGYARLALLRQGATPRMLRKQLDRERELGLQYASLGSARDLHENLLLGIAWYCFFEDRPLPACAAEFDRRIDAHRGELGRWYERILAVVRPVLAARFDLVRLMDGLTSPAFAPVVADARYLEALHYRLTHLQGRVQRDEEGRRVVAGFAVRLARLREQPGLEGPAWYRLRYALEELRVALFAEPLGTRGKISPQRLDREFLDAERALGLA